MHRAGSRAEQWTIRKKLLNIRWIAIQISKPYLSEIPGGNSASFICTILPKDGENQREQQHKTFSNTLIGAGDLVVCCDVHFPPKIIRAGVSRPVTSLPQKKRNLEDSLTAQKMTRKVADFTWVTVFPAWVPKASRIPANLRPLLYPFFHDWRCCKFCKDMKSVGKG